jgi:hypothetical protein
VTVTSPYRAVFLNAPDSTSTRHHFIDVVIADAGMATVIAPLAAFVTVI